MRSPVILSIFPGIDLLGRAFEEVWPEACLVRGPDLLWGGDIHTFHPPPGVFDGVIGGPPCQAFSQLAHLVRANGYETAPNLIPEFERVVAEAQPTWFLMENVRDAPTPVVAGYIVETLLFNNRWGPEAPPQNRLRRFSFGTRDGRQLIPNVTLFECAEYHPAVLAHGGNAYPVVLGGSGKPKRPIAAQELGRQATAYFEASKRLQGVPADYDLPGFTVAGKIRAVNNGVPMPMGSPSPRPCGARWGSHEQVRPPR